MNMLRKNAAQLSYKRDYFKIKSHIRMKMRKSLYKIVLVAGLALLLGCEDFISLHPLDEANVENSFQNPDDINLGVMGVYDALQSGGYPQDMAILAELITDNARTQSHRLGIASADNLREVAFFQLTDANSNMERRWNELYQGIARANLVLEKIEEISFSGEDLKNQYIGEAKFLRAIFYFDLVRFFGGVPVSLSEISSSDEAFALERKSEEEVFSVIIEDLQDAISLLPVSYNDTNVGRATEGAAKALLARVYLTSNEPDLAIPLLRELTESPYSYDLMDNYAGVFEGDNTRESIFEIQYTTSVPGEGSPYPNWFLPEDPTSGEDIFGDGYLGGNGTGISLATMELWNAFEEDDSRKDFTIAKYYSEMEADTIYRVNKYKEPPARPNDSEDNIILLRYADVLLMLAEAINESNNGPTPEAYSAVDAVRARAGLTPWDRTLDYEGFKMELLEERRFEFSFENHRWFDLKRYDQAFEILSDKGYAIQSHHVLFPVPRSEISINSLIEQNPGY